MRRRGRKAGEATASYLAHPLPIAERVYEMTPDARIVAVVRDPADRTYSHYVMARERGNETASTFKEALELEDARHSEYLHGDMREHPWHMYLEQGEYARHLERRYEHFPREQIMVIDFDDFVADPPAVLDTV